MYSSGHRKLELAVPTSNVVQTLCQLDPRRSEREAQIQQKNGKSNTSDSKLDKASKEKCRSRVVDPFFYNPPRVSRTLLKKKKYCYTFLTTSSHPTTPFTFFFLPSVSLLFSNRRAISLLLLSFSGRKKLNCKWRHQKNKKWKPHPTAFNQNASQQTPPPHLPAAFVSRFFGFHRLSAEAVKFFDCVRM